MNLCLIILKLVVSVCVCVCETSVCVCVTVQACVTQMWTDPEVTGGVWHGSVMKTVRMTEAV